ncbi:DUF2909 domain-containing protein [Deefgea tanakiae]|uniref:DUF2909 domain-containing protein n=1 Tax=Deefgea tanakiae TaxID=2865840 RepID=A0ABX8Z859_9NEIS|nr:DUF2909 family protein [Deefgea tanakiae]QZA77340.1 DUF2909 domain-containing protein [Deefgea tanakiae]
MKIVVIIVLLAIIVLMSQALTRLVRGTSHGLLLALTWRVGLSISLFIFLILAGLMGWIRPNF